MHFISTGYYTYCMYFFKENITVTMVTHVTFTIYKQSFSMLKIMHFKVKKDSLFTIVILRIQS